MAVARERRVVRGRRLRVDTTVVETNIHYPTDSTLLADGVRVLTRTLTRLRATATAGVVRLRDRTRSVGRRVFEITQLSRQAKQEPVKRRMRMLYRALMGHTRAVVRHAETAVRQVARGTVRGVGLAQGAVEGLAQQLRATTGLVRRVLAQTRARILSGNTHYPDKLLSLFEPHTEIDPQGQGGEADGVRQAGEDPGGRGASSSPTTRSARRACRIRRCGSPRWSGTRNCSAAPHAWPSPMAALPRGRMSRPRTTAACARWPCRGDAGKAARAPFEPRCRWRTGCEGRISALKRRHGLRRCRYRGVAGMAAVGRASA